MFPPTRDHALAQLADYAPKAGIAYAQGRNYDLDAEGQGAVSQLSPYIRHRLITEEEVLREILRHHSPKAAEKFVREVFWRSYWKGWLEMRPSVWTSYRAEVQAGLNRVQTEAGLRAEFETACQGQTEIDCFNIWAHQLVRTGYLHNHARMWFASIWIFTLRLPWALGADFFLRHLLDGDPASNTLGWRWVAGLQTRGKTYLAGADNIAKFTRGRFSPDPSQLAGHAAPLEGPENPKAGPAPVGGRLDPSKRTALLIHEEDITCARLHAACQDPVALATLSCAADRSPLAVSDTVTGWTAQALAGSYPSAASLTPQTALDWATSQDITQIATPYAPEGPAKEALDRLEATLRPHGIALERLQRSFDAMVWPKATKGFFPFKENIPAFLSKLGLQPA